jgi:hypothetical protein
MGVVPPAGEQELQPDDLETIVLLQRRRSAPWHELPTAARTGRR